MAKQSHAPGASVPDDRTRPMMALPSPEEGAERFSEDSSLTRPMAALPDPDEPSQAPPPTPDPTVQMRGLVSPQDEVEDKSSLTRQMPGLSALWGVSLNDESEPPG